MRFSKLFSRPQTIERHQKSSLWIITLLVGIVLNALMIILPFWKLLPLQNKEAIPLHYNALFGVDLLGSWTQTFYLPAIGIVILFANLFFERLLVKREKTLSPFFLVATLLVEVILFVSMIFIVLLNL